MKMDMVYSGQMVNVPQGKESLESSAREFELRAYSLNCIFNINSLISPERSAENMLYQARALEKSGVLINWNKFYEVTRGFTFAYLYRIRNTSLEEFYESRKPSSAHLSYEELLTYVEREEKYWKTKLGLLDNDLEKILKNPHLYNMLVRGIAKEVKIS